ncbi:MAG: D-alanyl-D-alanine carboxypeptidase/D-alanyl-D-alanine-endopeptidase [Phycisphaerales bacterium JB040]
MTTARPIAALAALLLVVQVALPQSLQTRLESIIYDSPAAGAEIGVAIVDVRTGRVIAGYNAGEAMIPASNMKILTSGAALLTLGPDFAFRTRFLVHESGGRRTLVVVGDGDPALGDPELLGRGTTPLDVEGLLDKIAGALQKKGIDRLDEIVLDDRVFEADSLHPSWPRDQLNRWYCAEVSGLNFHTNTVTVFPVAGSPGGVPSLTLEPRVPWLEVHNRARTVSRGSNTVWVSRPDDTNALTVFGDVRYRSEIPVAVSNPTRFTGRVLATALAERGIAVGPAGGTPNAYVRSIGPGEDFAEAEAVAIVRTSIADVLARCNVDSHNLYAEALLKRTGHAITGEPGSWANGGAVIRMLLRDHLGPGEAGSVSISDGSVMSRDNRVAPEILARWLAALYRDESVREPLLVSLPEPGQGTLRSRFADRELVHRIEAKSGYLNGVYALSGLLIAGEDRAVAFSILLNEVPGGQASRAAKPLHEDIVQAVDAWLSEQGAAALGG